MPKLSAGLLLYRRAGDGVEFFLVHPGGPFWASKDQWSIPKGEIDTQEDALAGARREFAEETGQTVDGRFEKLGEFRQPGGSKIIAVWLVEADCDADAIAANSFEMEWPPRSGRRQRFPEIDRAAWFAGDVALTKVHKGQRPIVQAALDALQ